MPTSTEVSNSALHTHFAEVKQQIQHAAQAANRNPDSIALLAVSKTKPASAIAELYRAGQRQFGENYLQEAIDKISELSDLKDITWHFIGPLQSNKTKDVAQHFDWVHSIDREKLVRRLNNQRPSDLKPLNILIQVNIDDEASKAGVSLEEINALAASIVSSERLQLRGIMAIPNPEASAEEQEQSFKKLENAYRELQTQYADVDTLSLGMSNDLALAIRYGSTMVRIGTALFGARNK
ncbi:YggS family pyridoxal phosphate-dependent enzyme [Aliidiomarina shirensis]|uniref:Pyridoxal phosphate homeostasis protein n=1 Tax=Aliidiomarina shirensis TaxID=1048642 RepID=A0A432WKU0_9GAMM|nr:YggS family pyridoxal phosphate-dependent enzyme [Aliidiomarina shirensis]RUO34385.1 YggS family pyridoxal phosphate-dependent enzyme [Aliidiomarina shirensis]